MAFKFIVSLMLLAVAANAVPIEVQQHHHQQYQQPIVYSHQPQLVHGGHHGLYEHHDAPAEYSFSYAVHDEHTGDIKSQHETRKGDHVQGSYDLIDSDGHKRIVEYSADAHNGFNAIVHREPTHIQIPQPHYGGHHEYAQGHHYQHAAPVAHHYQHAVPVVSHHAAPVAHHYQHSAPVAHISHHAAPIAHHYQHSAPVAHIAHHAAPIAHHYQHSAPVAQISHHAAPVAHISHHAAPVAHISHHAAPVAHHYQHSAPVAHVSYAAAPHHHSEYHH